MDLYTLTKADLDHHSWSIDFDVERDGKLAGFVIWFDCIFPECDAILSTDVALPSTHWEQDSFLFDSAVPVTRGEKIEVTACMKLHQHWKRHYELEFHASVGKASVYKHFLS